MSRQDQWLVTVTVDGAPLGTFDKLDGGDTTGSDTKYRPGGMVPEISLGGPTTIDNITVSRLYDLTRDHALAQRLTARVGRARVMTSQQPLDPNGVAWGDPITRGGTLMKVTMPKVDSSSNAAATFELEISCDGTTG